MWNVVSVYVALSVSEVAIETDQSAIIHTTTPLRPQSKSTLFIIIAIGVKY